MSTTLDWPEIAIRLLLTVIAGGVVGLNRIEHGLSAGLRTNILVCLAASVSMIQANLLLSTAGRHGDSFIMLDLMRLPLGVLSGMGFIGGGAILRRGDRIQGVTTAATLWFVTIMGLCFGGGQIALGITVLAIAAFALWVLKWVEDRMELERHALLVVTLAGGGGETAVREALLAARYRITSSSVIFGAADGATKLRYDVKWRGVASDTQTPAAIEQLARQPGVRRLQWRP